MFTLKKEERLHSRRIIQETFNQGLSFYIAPFMVYWSVRSLPSLSPVQTLFSAKKKNIRLAVNRNRIKRMMKEAFRLNKSSLYSSFQKRKEQCAIMLIYAGKTVPDYLEVESKIILILRRLVDEYEKTSG